MPQDVLSISQLNNYIRDKIDQDFLLNSVAVRGEISNYKIYPSGHHYFTLKDESASLRCVMFKGNTFRLRFRPENGMKVIAMGKISVYPRDGAYQLYCTGMTVDGVGDLYAAFEQLKAKLSKEGYFDPSHKKPIPQFPKTIGIVTSSAGAAVHDILRILRKRYPLSAVKILPVRVQGVEAPAEIAGAICYANQWKLADVLIVGRGGGSMEDLWAFNDELVAKAIYDSDIPVISAVGHEPDVTISDYVADLRAATPSNAAELVVPDQESLIQYLDSMLSTLTTSVTKQLTASRRHWTVLASNNTLKGPTQYIGVLRKNLNLLKSRILSLQANCVNGRMQQFLATASKLDAMSPLKVLTRGYALVEQGSGELVRSVTQIHCGDELRLTVGDGSFHASVTEIRRSDHEQ